MKLTNKEILLAGQAFARLNAVKFPLKTGMALVKTATVLDKQIEVIEKMRQSIFKAHVPKDEDGKEALSILPNTPQMDAFNKEWLELLEMEEDVSIVPVKLPEKIAATCDKCHHNMDKMLEIEPEILKPLVNFVE